MKLCSKVVFAASDFVISTLRADQNTIDKTLDRGQQRN